MFSYFPMGIVVGMFVAKWLVENKWRVNASEIRRIESGGELYKVLLADDYDRLTAFVQVQPKRETSQ